ncbi:hypothetical protein [Frondihabitans sp. VKM Ac-2883]|uniref:hypothetical protein n=1 Tax=Frondihabitans sp. VKM Ac-2883 TaxID=2783823 RepID=UPI00188A9CD6|nr:hypothetical protein [Frondihabitans sp. VKM Ac-2883]MBF4577139.1 hypothetical protein [Frondihabitans sp. VKM Ac-2883]
MNVGSVVLGVSTALAITAAVGAGIAISASQPAQGSEPIQGPQIGVCGSPQESDAATFHSMAASFLIKNTSGSPVTIRAIRPQTLKGLASATVTLARGADDKKTDGYEVAASIGVPATEVAHSSPVAADGTTIAPHSFATIITSMTLADGARAGSAGDFELTSKGPFGTFHTQMIRATVGLGVDASACTDLSM